MFRDKVRAESEWLFSLFGQIVVILEIADWSGSLPTGLEVYTGADQDKWGS